MAQTLSNLPVGALIKFGKHQISTETALPIIWVVADKNHSGYPSNSVTLVAQNIIDSKPFDARESTYVNGNPDYALSNINQWLNSSASAGNWYSATHSQDAPPAYQTSSGFLYNFTESERIAILPTALTLVNSALESKTMTSNVFLLSEWEILGSGSVEDGSSRLEYFKSNAVTASMTEQAYTYSYEKPSAITSKWTYATRSSQGESIKSIRAAGTSVTSYPYDTSYGLRPAVNLSASTKISTNADNTGCYTFVANTFPVISGSNSNLGTKYAEFSHSYSVNDADTDDSVTVTEYIDNTSIRSYVASKNATNTFAVTGNTWLKLTNGSHTLKITATDGFNTVTRTITFTKLVTRLVVQRTTPIEASKMPTRIVVTLVKNVPSNSTVTVWVCNNGFDSSPTWEKFETYASGLAHTFSNKTNTAEKWGVNVKVTVERGDGEGACYITEIGGNFE